MLYFCLKTRPSRLTFDQFAVRRARALAGETLDVARHHLVVSQQPADVYVIVRGHVVARRSGEHRLLLLPLLRGHHGAAAAVVAPDGAGLMDERDGGGDDRDRLQLHRKRHFGPRM